MHVKHKVVLRIHDVHHVLRIGLKVAAPVLGPAVPARPLRPGNKNKVCGPCGADGVNGSLVVLKDEGSGHVVRLVHNAKHDVVIVLEAARQLAPELGELLCGRGSLVRGVSDDAARHWLLGGVVVAHIAVRVEDGIWWGLAGGRERE